MTVTQVSFNVSINVINPLSGCLVTEVDADECIWCCQKLELSMWSVGQGLSGDWYVRSNIPNDHKSIRT